MGAVNIPIKHFAKQSFKIQNKKNVVVFCASGMRSSQAKAILSLATVSQNVHNGGAWHKVIAEKNKTMITWLKITAYLLSVFYWRSGRLFILEIRGMPNRYLYDYLKTNQPYHCMVHWWVIWCRRFKKEVKKQIKSYSLLSNIHINLSL